jgi:hypothetical protein
MKAWLTRDSSGKSFFANADIENKELTAYEIAKKRVSGWVSSLQLFIAVCAIQLARISHQVS